MNEAIIKVKKYIQCGIEQGIYWMEHNGRTIISAVWVGSKDSERAFQKCIGYCEQKNIPWDYDV